jgi:3-hydroxyacyl-[acyl-carrier-protein] dehydratase
MYYFVGIDGARFKRPVLPGDQLVLEVSIARTARQLWKYSAQALVDGQVAAQAELMCTYKMIVEDVKA